jgi:hypothetical protein
MGCSRFGDFTPVQFVFVGTKHGDGLIWAWATKAAGTAVRLEARRRGRAELAPPLRPRSDYQPVPKKYGRKVLRPRGRFCFNLGFGRVFAAGEAWSWS